MNIPLNTTKIATITIARQFVIGIIRNLIPTLKMFHQIVNFATCFSERLISNAPSAPMSFPGIMFPGIMVQHTHTITSQPACTAAYMHHPLSDQERRGLQSSLPTYTTLW